jgi:hypothetical protein
VGGGVTWAAAGPRVGRGARRGAAGPRRGRQPRGARGAPSHGVGARGPKPLLPPPRAHINQPSPHPHPPMHNFVVNKQARAQFPSPPAPHPPPTPPPTPPPSPPEAQLCDEQAERARHPALQARAHQPGKGAGARRLQPRRAVLVGDPRRPKLRPASRAPAWPSRRLQASLCPGQASRFPLNPLRHTPSPRPGQGAALPQPLPVPRRRPPQPGGPQPPQVGVLFVKARRVRRPGRRRRRRRRQQQRQRRVTGRGRPRARRAR